MNLSSNFCRTLLALCCFAPLWMGCEGSQAPSTPGTIAGHIQGLDEGTPVVLRSFKEGALVNVAKTQLDATGAFALTPEPAISMGYHQLLVGASHPLVLITGPSESVFVDATAHEGENYMVDASISGSPASKNVATYYNVIMPLQARIAELEAAARRGSPAERAEAKNANVAKIDSIADVSLAFAKANADKLEALSALESLDPKKHSELFQTTLASLKGEHGKATYFQKISQMYDAALQPRKLNMPNPAKKRTGKNSKVGTGDTAPDIVMNDPDGREIRLSDLRGKVVLLDFWASWCGPCRRENPNVVRAYQKYNGAGFEVFSVSLDSDVNRWKKAIEQDQLSWPYHVSDLAGWRNAAAREYGISSIPHTMLIDRDGQVLATHLRGGALEKALASAFEK